ncbi:MAG: hypothetical protein EBV65_07385, partial [Gammaproteobacteria bacterium]|nr:hypothetical protein [Gammaproteobacteria bacterium]
MVDPCARSLRRALRTALLAAALLVVALPPPAVASGFRSLLTARNDALEQNRPPDVPDDATLESAGAKIGKVTV